MPDESHRNSAPVPSDGGDPATQAGVPASAPLDANGFDPSEFEWRPVPRRPRKDGWTPEAQQRFIEALARTGVVERACEEVGLSVRSAYDLRNRPGGERFAAAWAAVLTRAADRLLDIAFEQAIDGEEVPIFDQDGVRTGVRRRYNTRMAMFLLRAYHPDRFRHAHQDGRSPRDETRPPAAAAVPPIVASLAPVTPEQPHLLMPPQTLQWQVEDARDDAKALAADPPDEREPWRPHRIPDQHPRVHDRARRNRARRARCEERRDELNEQEGRPGHGDDWDDGNDCA
ncbi:hypothetical protein [uncultured Sphingomonas sp.]|uniref:hypothetical protein n=1 Tax=uncultured Sphingomonas sp. TaxID=158754 RepID=UPI0035CA24FF